MANKVSFIHGKLLSAVKNGGESVLWNIARGHGPVAEKAREVIELSTSPFIDLSVFQAIDTACKIVRR